MRPNAPLRAAQSGQIISRIESPFKKIRLPTKTPHGCAPKPPHLAEKPAAKFYEKQHFFLHEIAAKKFDYPNARRASFKNQNSPQKNSDARPRTIPGESVPAQIPADLRQPAKPRRARPPPARFPQPSRKRFQANPRSVCPRAKSKIIFITRDFELSRAANSSIAHGRESLRLYSNLNAL